MALHLKVLCFAICMHLQVIEYLPQLLVQQVSTVATGC